MTWREDKYRNLGPLLMILTVLVVAVVWYTYSRGGKLPGLSNALIPTREVENTILNQAPEGELVSGFSPELVVTEDSSVRNSFVSKAPGGAGGESIITIYRTKATVSDLYATYIAYMNDRGYEITSKVSWEGTAFVAGKSGSTTLSVSVSPLSTSEREVRVEVKKP